MQGRPQEAPGEAVTAAAAFGSVWRLKCDHLDFVVVDTGDPTVVSFESIDGESAKQHATPAAFLRDFSFVRDLPPGNVWVPAVGQEVVVTAVGAFDQSPVLRVGDRVVVGHVRDARQYRLLLRAEGQSGRTYCQVVAA